MSDQIFKILSIDGGGYRGVFAARVLEKIESLCGNFDWRNKFGLMAGTSTGSIIAAGLLRCHRDKTEPRLRVP